MVAARVGGHGLEPGARRAGQRSTMATSLAGRGGRAARPASGDRPGSWRVRTDRPRGDVHRRDAGAALRAHCSRRLRRTPLAAGDHAERGYTRAAMTAQPPSIAADAAPRCVTPRIFSRHPAVGDRPSGQRPGRDPQLRRAPARVRGDLLRRRLPRADEHPRPGRAAARTSARWPPRCSRWASTRSGARCSSRATDPSTPSSRWLLATVTPVSWVERTPTYKEKKQHQPDDVNHGLLTYPILQAADIVHLQGRPRAGGQGPGGPPRAVARDRPGVQPRYGETFPEPQAVFTEAPVVLGTDGVRKMSKSLGNTIEILAEPDVDPAAGDEHGHRHAADPAHRPGPAGGVQRLPAPPLLRRGLPGDPGRRADGPDRLRRHQAAAGRADHPATTPPPGSGTSS